MKIKETFFNKESAVPNQFIENIKREFSRKNMQIVLVNLKYDFSFDTFLAELKAQVRFSDQISLSVVVFIVVVNYSGFHPLKNH